MTVLLGTTALLLSLSTSSAQAEVPQAPVTIHTGTNPSFCLDHTRFQQ